MKREFKKPTTEKYCNYLKNNLETISNQIDDDYIASQDKIKKEMLSFLADILTPVPTHYEWHPVYDPYDHSGEIRPNGKIDMTQTLEDFLENEYNGHKIPSYTSGCGWFYEEYEENLSELTRDIGWSIMHENIRAFLEKEFGKLDEEALEDYNMDYIYDEIYDTSMANQFFFASAIVEFVGIEKMTLEEIVNLHN